MVGNWLWGCCAAVLLVLPKGAVVDAIADLPAVDAVAVGGGAEAGEVGGGVAS